MDEVNRLLFVHIPKTAGVSLFSALETWATPERSVRYERGDDEDNRRLAALSDPELERLRLIGGHLSLRVFRMRLDEAWSPITVLRDPLARMLSLYTFVTSTPKHPWYEEVAAMDLDEFLSWYGQRPYSVGQQCRLVSGQTLAEPALRTLRTKFLLACTLEHLEAMVGKLGEVLGQPLTVPRRNISKAPLDRSDLGSDTLRAIETINGADQELYEQVHDAGLVGRFVNGAAP